MKKRLTENQVTRLLNKGYSYKDIALYEAQINEQVWDKIKDAAKTVGSTALDYAVPDVIATPDQVNTAIGKVGKVAGQIPGMLKKGAADIGSKVGQLTKDNPAAAMGAAIGAASPLPGGAALGTLAGHLGQKIMDKGKEPAPGLPFGSFGDVITNKVKKLQGEGYTSKQARNIVEDFAGRTFGNKYISENIANSKIYKVRFNENEIRSIDEAWRNYITEQSLEDVSRELEEQGGSPIDGFKQMWDMFTDKQSWKDVGTGFSQLGDTFKDAATDAWDGVKSLFGSGDDDSKGTGSTAGQAAAKVAANALSKNEEMSPEKNHTALRDWTSKMKESLMQEKDYDGDGKVETGTQEYLGSRDKAIKKAMSEKTVFYTDDKDRTRVFDDNQ